MQAPIALDGEINIVHIDPMPETSIERAFEYLRETHKKRPYLKPIALHWKDGRFVISVGNVVTMTAREIATDFQKKLKEGDKHAVELNRVLNEIQLSKEIVTTKII